MAESLSLEYQTRLALSKEEGGELKETVYLRNINRIEGQRMYFRNISRMEGKVKGGSTSQVTVTSSSGITIEYTGEEKLRR